MLKESIDRYFYNMTTFELQLMNRKIISSEITYNSLLYLDMIAYQHHCTASWIAEKLQVSRSAVTVKTNDLIQQGLVRKVQSEEDKRVFYLEITEAAQDLYKLYDKGLYHAIEEVRKQYSEEEIAIFCRILDTLDANYYKELEHEYQTD